MTSKIYKSAMGKSVDLGSLLLRNEHVRAVGNMNVNARGDVLDSSNQVIDQKNKQVQRQYKRTTTNVSSTADIHTSTRSAKKSAMEAKQPQHQLDDEIFAELNQATPMPDLVEESVQAENDETVSTTGGGLAAAIARSRIIKQEKEKSLREREKPGPIKRI
jgi:hypothetical protein